jgi:hypothetical protein
MQCTTDSILLPLSVSQIEDLKLASTKMSGAESWVFQAAMTLKYCKGNAHFVKKRKI